MGCASPKLTDGQSRQLSKHFEHGAHVGQILNKMRKNPASYVEFIEKNLKNFQKQKFVKIHAPQMFSQIKYQTVEGPLPWKQAIKFLKSTYPISHPLIKNSVLTEAASQRARLFAQKQLKPKSAKYVPNTDLAEQLKLITGLKIKQGEFVVLIGMDFKIRGRNYVQNALIGLVIDDGVPNRTNRNHLFSQKYSYYGSYTTVTQDHVIVVLYLSTQNLVRTL